VRIEQCELQDNGNGGLLAVSATDIAVVGNRIQGNRGHDIEVRGGSSGLLVSRNRFSRGGPWKRGVHVADDTTNVTLAGDNSSD